MTCSLPTAQLSTLDGINIFFKFNGSEYFTVAIGRRKLVNQLTRPSPLQNLLRGTNWAGMIEIYTILLNSLGNYTLTKKC